MSWSPGSGPTSGADSFRGDDRADNVETAGAGTDTLDGRGGDDALGGGTDADLLLGGNGDDVLTGDTGADTLDGGDGFDRADFGKNGAGQGIAVSLMGGLDGLGFTDLFRSIEDVRGGDGNDRVDFGAATAAGELTGGLGNDTLLAGASNDSLRGDGGADSLEGGAGNDSLDGGDGIDTLMGGEGADSLVGGNGGDFLRGGAGADTLRASDNVEWPAQAGANGEEGDDYIIVQHRSTSVQGGDGIDTADFSLFTGDARVWFNASQGGFIEDGVAAVLIRPVAGIERVIGTSGADALELLDFGFAVTLDGRDGDDVLRGGSFADLLLGGNGSDQLAGRAGNNTLDGGEGNDTLDAWDGDDLQSGGNGDDLQYGSGGNDTLLGGSGSDTLFGWTDGDLLSGGDGDDVQYGEAGNDTLLGGNGADTLPGDAGADSLSGGDDSDTLTGGNGDDTLEGGLGLDTLAGGEGNDSLSGGEEDDRLRGDAGADTLDAGNGGYEELAGGDGDDVLMGGAGIHVFIGDDGTDAVDYGANGAAQPIAASHVMAADGLDTFGGGGPGSFDFFLSIERILGGAGADSITFAEADFAATLDGRDGADTLLGSGANDRLDGGAGGDRLSGGGGADTLLGGGGADTIVAGNTNALVEGGEGNDLLSAGGGNNTIRGGNGDDLITLLGTPGNADTIQGGNGQDTLTYEQAGFYRITNTGSAFRLDHLGADSAEPVLAAATFDGIEGFAYNNGVFDLDDLGSGEDVLLAVCFAAGTRIATPEGETPVEALRPGDLVLTADGTAEPALFVGRRHVVLAGHANATEMAPVRIAAGALGDGLPRRDLVVSPDHCLVLDGALVPARLLVNGATIMRETACAEVTWLHVELPRHAVILAEGAPAESWLDTGNRAWFANAPAALLRIAGNLDAAGTGWDATRACAPLVHGGPRLAAIRARLGACAAVAGAHPSAA